MLRFVRYALGDNRNICMNPPAPGWSNVTNVCPILPRGYLPWISMEDGFQHDHSLPGFVGVPELTFSHLKRASALT